MGVTEDFFAELLEEEFLDLMLHSVLKNGKKCNTNVCNYLGIIHIN